MTDYPRSTLTTTPRPLLEDVEVLPIDPMEVTQEQLRELTIDVIHDGDFIPEAFLTDAQGAPISMETLRPDYVRERDWGAMLVAERVCARLGVSTYSRVNVARVLMDFGRFPGSTPRQADHLHRYAINYPFSEMLSIGARREVLESYYDEISAAMERRLDGKRIKIAIHTYDQYNESGTERPATSIITRTLSYQNSSAMPAGLFDPLFPDILGEFTADRILRDRLSLMLEKSNIPVAHNYPYCLPEGSLEVRYQVWMYFCSLRTFFEEKHPETQGDPCFELVWRMLLDTNLRSAESDTLRSYIHMYRRAPAGRELEFQRAARAYEKLCAFCHSETGVDFVTRYRFSPERASSLGLEVRKDLLVELDEERGPIRVKWENVAKIGDTLARALCIYLTEDRKERDQQSTHDFGRHDPWYRPM